MKGLGDKTVYFKDNNANPFAFSTDVNGKATNYEYDAAGRLVKEGGKGYKSHINHVLHMHFDAGIFHFHGEPA